MSAQRTSQAASEGVVARERVVVESVPRNLYVAGEWREASGGGRLAVEDPSTGEELTDVADAQAEDALAALGAAADVQARWASTAPPERGEILRRAAEGIVGRSEELTLPSTAQTGKEPSQAR